MQTSLRPLYFKGPSFLPETLFVMDVFSLLTVKNLPTDKYLQDTLGGMGTTTNEAAYSVRSGR